MTHSKLPMAILGGASAFALALSPLGRHRPVAPRPIITATTCSGRT